jgi:hypothetical protein
MTYKGVGQCLQTPYQGNKSLKLKEVSIMWIIKH